MNRFIGISLIALLALSACATVGMPTLPNHATVTTELLGSCVSPFTADLHLRWWDTDGDRTTGEYLTISVIHRGAEEEVIAVIEGLFPDGLPWTLTRAHVKTTRGFKHYDSMDQFEADWPEPCDIWKANQAGGPA